MYSGVELGQVDLDRAPVDADRVHRHGEARRDPARASGECEIVSVPRADDRVALEPAFGQRPVFVGARRAGGIELPAAGVEDGDGDAAALDQHALAHGDLVDLGNLDVGHQRRSWSALSMTERNSSVLVAPITRWPLIRKVGVPVMPSACACSTSRSTSFANRRSSRQRANSSRSRPSSAAYASRSARRNAGWAAKRRSWYAQYFPAAPAQRAASCAGRARLWIASGRSLKTRRTRPSRSEEHTSELQ